MRFNEEDSIWFVFQSFSSEQICFEKKYNIGVDNQL